MVHAKPVRRCDITPLRPVERLADGRVKCDAHFGRAGIQVYHNPDGSERRELRPEAEVFKPASMRSFAMVPFTDDHPNDLLTAATAGPYVKGSTGDTITRDDDHLRGNIGVFDAATIAKMEAGKREVSCGYTCDLLETPGVHPVWGKYDAIQTNIIGNHLALVDKGRAGSAAIRMDASYAVVDADWNEEDHPRAEDGKFGSSGATREANAATRAANQASNVRGIASSPAITAAHERAADAHHAAMIAHAGSNPEALREHAKAVATHTQAAGESRAGHDANRRVPEVGKEPPKEPKREPPRQQTGLQAVIAGAERAKKQPSNFERRTPEAEAARNHAYALTKKASEHDWEVRHNNGDKDAAKQAHAAAASGHEKAVQEFKKMGDPEMAKAHQEEVDKHKAAAKTGSGGPRFRGDAGIALALLHAHGTVDAMATRRDISAPAPDPDPDDLASRNARDPEREDKPDPGDDADSEDCYDSTLYDADGNVSESGAARMAASSWAMPGKQKLPIHDPKAVKDSMRRFGEHEFDSADEKHAAFNRIAGRAAQFGIGTTKFAQQHAGKLDRKDNEDMIDEKTKLEAAKAKKRKEQRDAANKRADGLATELATAQGQVASLTADLAAEKAKTGTRTDAAQTEFDTKVAGKVDLVVKAATILGVGKVDAKSSDGDIKRAVIKHVDKVEVPADKHPAYVDALFDGAVSRATADAAATAGGAAALAAARGAVAPVLPVAGDPKPAVPHVDAEDDDEAAAAKRMRDRSAGAARQPSRMTKDSVLAQINGSK